MTKTALIAVAAVAAIVVASWVTTPNFNVNVNPVVSAGQFEFDTNTSAGQFEFDTNTRAGQFEFDANTRAGQFEFDSDVKADNGYQI